MTLTLSVPPRPAAGRLADLPIAVIGAGPVGLAAAAHLLERGLDVVVFEAGEQAGSAVADWAHTRLFSPWKYLIDPAGARLLDSAGWAVPDAAYSPTGGELLDSYISPLAHTPELESRIRVASRVIAVSRQGMDRTRSTGRADTPFLVRVERAGEVTDVLARAVVDTSGTWGSPNPVVASGVEPDSAASAGRWEEAADDRVITGLPDVLGRDRSRFAGGHVLVVGAGHSAANSLLALDHLAETETNTRVSWAIRNDSAARVFTSADDELPDRASIGQRVEALVRAGRISLIDRFEIDAIDRAGDSAGAIRALGRRAGEPLVVEADIIVNATGFRPDLRMLREVRLGLDDIVEAPRALAPLIDPNLHSCGTVAPHGVAELAHPEPNFYIAGMKSYGRAPTFLLATGYEQVRSIADELAGRHEAARTVGLVLPETGVCCSTGDSAGC